MNEQLQYSRHLVPTQVSRYRAVPNYLGPQ